MIWLQLIHFNRYFLIIWVLYLWCITRFGISHYLTFVWLFERMQMHANAFFYLHVVAWVSMAFEQVYQMSNVWMPFKWVNTNTLMTFEWCFLISKYHENCNAMSSFTVLHHVSWKKNFFAVQSNFFISLLWFSFSDAAGNEHSLLKFQWSRKCSKIITIKKILLPSGIEICSLDLKFQWQILQEIS